jgi:phosphate-selective porin OprO/OprP
MHPGVGGRRVPGLLLAVAIVALGDCPPVAAQALSVPPRGPSAEAHAIVPERLARLEAKVGALEARIEQLSGQAGRLSASPPSSPDRVTGDDGARAGLGASGGSAPPFPRSPRAGMAEAEVGRNSQVRFEPAFQLRSGDDEYLLQVGNLLQFDGRFFEQGGQTPVHDTFAIPREWLIFSGRLTRPYEFYASIAHGFQAVSLLDAFINLHYDDRLQLKVGRFVVPFSFEPYMLPVRGLITPEYSLFFNNFEPNRDLGVMAWGQVARERVDYAAGIFNGNRNGLLDTNDAKDVVGLLNARPFHGSGIPALENLNVGGSVDYGDELNAPNPQTLRTIVPLPGNATVGVPFLSFNNNVRESGVRALWSLHMAYYHRHLSLIGEWDAGFQDYARDNGASRTRLPIRSYYVEAGYFLTGETVTSRNEIKPLRNFDLRPGRRGPGAWELGTRYNGLRLGPQVFTAGLADPNLWTDRVATTDVGLNWYWNPYFKVALFWEHAEFGQPVLYAPGARQKTSDLFLIRFQLRL